MGKSKMFSVMVVGDDPSAIMKEYDMSLKVEGYVKYKYLDAEKYKNTAIKVLSKLLDEYDKVGIKENMRESLKNRLTVLKKMSAFEYYRDLTDGLYYDEDGNAVSTENPNGKWKTAKIGRNFSLPLVLKGGGTSYQAKASDVDWESMHLANKPIYEAAWEVVVEKREPSTDEEKAIYANMKDRTAYFAKFPSKDEYVMYSTAYWNYAYVDKDGWKDINTECNGDEHEWISSFYDRFVKTLNPNDKVSIYECSIEDTTDN